MSDNYSPQGGWQQGPPQPQGGWQQHGAPQQQGSQGGWQQQPHGQQNWSGQPTQQGWPQQGQQYPQGPAGWSGGGQPPKKKNLGVIITAVAVVLALAAGVTIWLVSKKDSDTAVGSGGEATPMAAASTLLNSLNDKDVIGVAQKLDPTEAQIFADISGDMLKELQRLGIIREDVKPETLTGSTVEMKDLKFDEGKAETVNDHVTIVKLVSGQVTINSDATKVPYTDKIKKLFPNRTKDLPSGKQTYNIAELVKKNGGEPIRIATVKRGDKWYPSLFYTAADYWLQDAKKSNRALAKPMEPLKAVGAGSPEDAVKAMMDAGTKGDLKAAIGMLPPDEMGVFYDYGAYMLKSAGMEDARAPKDAPKFSNLEFNTEDVTGGTKVSFKHVTVEVDGQKVDITLDAGAGELTIEQKGEKQVIKGSQLAELAVGQSGRSSSGSNKIDPKVGEILDRLFKKVLGMGIVTTEVDGKHYVSPLRTTSGVFISLLQGLEAGDIDYLLAMGK